MRVLHGAVVIRDEDDTLDMLALLSAPIQAEINYTYFPRPQDVTWSQAYDFVILNHPQDLEALVSMHQQQLIALPMILYFLATQDADTHPLRNLPADIEIKRIIHNGLDKTDTLQYETFSRALHQIREKSSNN